MTLRIANEDIQEVRRALSIVYAEVIRELGQRSGSASEAGIQLCRRKWKLEDMLRQLDSPEQPPAALKMVPRRHDKILERVAA